MSYQEPDCHGHHPSLAPEMEQGSALVDLCHVWWSASHSAAQGTLSDVRNSLLVHPVAFVDVESCENVLA